MDLPDNRGMKSRQRREENRSLVWGYYRLNPHATQSEVASSLGMHVNTVGFHYRAIKAGWKPAYYADQKRP